MTQPDASANDKKIRELYRYDEMSNKVLRVDRTLHSQKTDPSRDAALSQPRSMAGRISVKEMGDAANSEANASEQGIHRREVDQREERYASKQMPEAPASRAMNSTVLGSDSLQQLRYHPSNEVNTSRYEKLVQTISQLLGDDMPHDVVLSATDYVLQTLKGEKETGGTGMDQKLSEIQDNLSVHISQTSFHEIIETSKSITDYFNAENQNGDSQDVDRGVAILASEDEREENESPDGNALMTELEEGEREELDVEERSTEYLTNNESKLMEQDQDSQDIVMFSNQSDIPYNLEAEVPIFDVDEQFLYRCLCANLKNDPGQLKTLAESLLGILGKDEAEIEVEIVRQIPSKYRKLIDFLLANSKSIFWGTHLSHASAERESDLLAHMNSIGLTNLVREYEGRSMRPKRRLSSTALSDDRSEEAKGEGDKKKHKKSNIPELLNLQELLFHQGSELLTRAQVTLPADSFKRVKPSYEEIHIPAPSPPSEKFEPVPITALPTWARVAFPANETTYFNRVQSEVFSSAFGNDENMLVCAPTGAGKTNIAMLAILRALSHHRNSNQGTFNLKNFKVVYIAPLKALVQEQVRELQRRLTSFGIIVGELTGDSNLTSHQIAESTVLVSTPEKWDIITRKKSDSSVANLVALLIIDEVHLLHDERGPVIETIVARILRNPDTRDRTRIVALSATLPNYADVGRFLRLRKENLFFFDSSYRPCPLAQQFCGITESNGIKKVNAMNQACYDKLLEVVKEGHQVIVFVHSRKDTVRTALWLKNKLLDEENLKYFVKSEPGSREIVQREAETVSDTSLAELLQHGFGVHHAGLSKSDRSLSEDLFADGLLSVLVSTATLAWGVNLPAHAVIIKGTDVYSPEKGTWTKLSPQDVLQMLGRAGRPRYDTYGEGIIITQQSSIQYYLAMLNHQLPIESQLIANLSDIINSEIVLGNLKTRNNAVDWLGFTYFFVRVLENPELYKVPENLIEEKLLVKYREALAHSALQTLHNHGLVVYDSKAGAVRPTELGKIASLFYIKYHSISMYNQMINENLTSIELLRIFSKSDEFKYIPVRQEEKMELQKLLDKAPIPIQESADSPLSKINILLQSYISRTRLDGFALKSDMVYITQSAGRLTRALYELSLKRNLPKIAKMLLNLSKSIEKRMWITNSALRQFKNCPQEVIRHTEASFLPWNDYFELTSPREVGEAIRSEKNGKLVYDLLKRFPRLEVNCSVQPLTPSLLHFDLEIMPNWIWDQQIHGISERFILMVEDEMGDKLLYDDSLTVHHRFINKEHFLDFNIFLSPSQQESLPSNFFVSLTSEKWIHSGVKVPVLLEDIRLPKRFPAPTALSDLQTITTLDAKMDEFSEALPFTQFSRIQSQVLPTVFDSNENVFIGTAAGSDKLTIAELALFNLWRQAGGRSVYVCPSQYKIDSIYEDWSERLGSLAGGKTINKFLDDNLANVKLLAKSHLILCTPQQFDFVSRKWKQRKNVQNISLLILDDVHMVGNGIAGAVYENIISRMNFISAQLETDLRVVGLSNSVANSREFGEWMRVEKDNIYNFSPLDRERPLQVKLQVSDTPAGSRANLLHDLLPNLEECFSHSQESKSMILFVSSRSEAIKVLTDTVRYCANGSLPVEPHNKEIVDSLSSFTATLPKEAFRLKMGMLHLDMSQADQLLTRKLFSQGHLRLIIVSREVEVVGLKSNTVVLLGTQFYEGREHRYVDYSVNEIHKMLSIATLSVTHNEALILTTLRMKEYYKKFLMEPLPVESFLYYQLPDLISNEVSTGVIESKQDCLDWLTYSLFYRRIHGNPSYYGVKEVSSMGISAYLTEVIEEAVKELVEISMIEAEDDQDDEDNHNEHHDSRLVPLNGCLISAHHNVSFTSMQIFHRMLSKTSGLRSMLEALSSALGEGSLTVRQSDGDILKALYAKVPLKVVQLTDFESSAFKAFILLQSYFTRFSLKNDLKADLLLILKDALPLVNSMVDFLAGEGHLNATIAMDMSQMLVQGMWDTDSPLLQVPYFTQGDIEKCKLKNVETVYDIMALEDDERDELLTFSMDELTSIANFVNKYPNIELTYSVEGSGPYASGAPLEITVTLTRDEEPEDLQVVAGRFPSTRYEGWWIIAGVRETKELYAIKKVSLGKETQAFNLEVSLEKGSHQVTLWCLSDSYVDADKEVSFELNVI
ncbi:LADA_0F03884g1_1 [Lachancea dasiensis]|uniref:U5 small nuclear ribonucleoprotein 200 kDa helicase n=1 Tax=Lachancea dasiensis TaxID=1072105 RepID=A0A1G4JIX5_9SACH|nr:LADA_0F03884g1_1 [Lachancea dasiensis]